MDFASLFTVVTPWHWLGLALVLLGIELMIGTFDLLWVSAAAFVTGLFSMLNLPAPFDGWQAEAIFFALASIGLIIIGRVFLGDWKNKKTDSPNLNKRSQSLIGKMAVAEGDFVGGEGRVKLGDTTWMATSAETILAGAQVRVESVDGSILQVVLT